MITFSELLKGITFEKVGPDEMANLYRLHYCLNVIRVHYGKPMIVTSGFRSKEDHLRIYSEINEKRKAEGKPELSVPMGSMHLRGAACDILDRDGSLQEWVKSHESLLVELGVYCEHFDYTGGWVHFQTLPPASGTRFFKPY